MTDTTTTPERRTRTITLTDRAPVRIVEDEWPLVAEGRDWEGEHQSQAPRTWTLLVRQHATDGRTLVYGICATIWQGESDRRGGVLLQPPTGAVVPNDAYLVWPALAGVIREVGEGLGMPERTIDACIADLPAEDL